MMNKFSSWTIGSKLGIVALCAVMLSACGTVSASEVELATVSVADLVTFKDRDTNTDWSADTSTAIQLNGTSATVDGSGAEAADGSVTITAAGTYVLSGELSDGQIVVDVQDDGDVQLVLNGVEIHNSDSSAIYVEEVGNAVITLEEGTENIVSDGETYVFPDDSTDEPNAAIFSKADLTINGAGKLTVTGNYSDGIRSKDDLKITGGTIEVEAVEDGIKGRDMVAVLDGNITVNAGADGIKSNNDSDAEKGFVAIAGGTFDVTAGTDGIQAETSLVIDGGTFTIVAGGGHENGEVKTPEDGPGEGGPGGPGGEWGNDTSEETTQTEETESESMKGLKATGDITVNDGSFNVDSADDAVHSNANISITGGSFELATGDDGIHADTAVNIAGGTIDITTSYEGIEGTDITISGGETRLIASDDGINAAGGDDESTTDEGQGFGQAGTSQLTISGGYLYVDADGDGLDANGSITMSGGTVIVNGPTSDGNGTLDYDGSFEISGGILAAAGSSGMAQAPSDTSSQYSVVMSFTETQQAGTLVHLEDSEGNEIITFAPEKDFQMVEISSPDLKEGSYTLYTGGTSTGSQIDGLYTDGTYTGGTEVVTFEITDSVTTWLNESGVTTGNNNGGPGGGGGMGGPRPMDQQSTEAQ